MGVTRWATRSAPDSTSVVYASASSAKRGGWCWPADREAERIDVGRRWGIGGRRRSAPPASARLLDERPVLQLAIRAPQFVLSVHHDRPVPRDRLLDRLAGDEQETDALLARLHGDLVARVEQHERAIAGSFAAHMLDR